MKIFGLGFHKTGTTTLETALIALGYNAIGKQDHLLQDIKSSNWQPVDEIVMRYDGFRDMPWPLYFEMLDEHYPKSKFILTVRDSVKWLESCKNHYKNKGVPIFSEIYGIDNHFPVGNEDVWLERYLLHNKNVREYFKGRPNDFLEVNWEQGDNWEKLCEFLEVPIPNREFPHANKGKYTLFEKVIRKIHYVVDKEGFQKKNRDL